EQPLCDETLNRVNITCDTADEVAGALLIMESQREFLNVRIDSSSQIVGNPLGNAGRQVFFDITGDRIQQSNCQYGHARETQHWQFIVPHDGLDPLSGCGMAFPGSQYVIKDDFQRPWL